MVNSRTSHLMTRGEKVFQVINYGLLLLLCVVFVVPFLTVIAKSVSSESAVLAGQVKLLPLGFHGGAYRFVLDQRLFFVSLANSVIVTAIGTVAAMTVTILAAYPLTKSRLPGSRLIMKLIVLTLVFSAGVIPGFLVVQALGLVDTRAALIIPAAINPFNVIILRTFMKGIPDSLEESAKIDGASYFVVLGRIIVPLATPSIAALSLFQAVALWNDFFRPLIFIRREGLYTLQLYLRGVLQQIADVEATLDPVAYADVAAQSVRNATIVLATVPILLVYPFVQRHFVTGIRLGSVKG